MKLNEILQAHLRRPAADAVARDAGAPPTTGQTEAEVLSGKLASQAAFNNKLIVATAAGYLAVLVLFSVLALVNRTNLSALATFLGGNLLALMAVGGRLQGLWREKNQMDMLIAILPRLNDEQALKVVQGLVTNP